MKILRPAAAAAALTASIAFSAHSEAADAEAIHVSPNATAVSQSVENTLSVARTYEQIRGDVTKAEFTGNEMLARIDSLVGRIDTLMNAATQDNNELMQLRNATLQMRGEVVQFLSGNGSQFVNLTTPLPPVENIVPSVNGQLGTEFLPIDGSYPGSTPGGFVSGGTTSGGSIGGGGGGGVGGGGMMGGGGGVGMLGAAAAAAAAGFSDDDNTPGPIASQSTP